ncbi:hypothetical protein KCU73_g10841, partial [Aureobasidium melanogenum]
RPLRLSELLHALAIDERIPYLDKENVPHVPHIIDACAGLIVVNETNNTIELFHKTLHEYLAKNQSVWFPQGNDTIGLMCVRYLSFDAFANGPCPEIDPASLWSKCQAEDRTLLYKKRLVQFPLYAYASQHWHDHVRGNDLETAHEVTTFLADANKLSASCQTLKSLAPRTTGAHFAVIHSLNHSLKRYLKLHRPQLNVKDDLGRSPLSYAAELGNLVAATLLIKAGADPKIEDNEPAHWVDWSIEAYNPLSYAAAKGHLRMTEFLLKAGAYVNNQDYRGRSALLYAAKGGSEDVVKLLLQHGSEPDSRDSKDRTPLFYAAAAGSAEASSLLLNRGANINHADSRGVTPLLLAARAGSEQVIALLIAKGAKVNPRCVDDDTPLSRAVEAKSIDSIRLLLRAGAEVDVYSSPLDPLSQACKTGPKEIVRLLLSAGGDVKNMSCRQVPPLAYAARNGWIDVVQLFLAKGAAADNIDRSSQSVLSYAVESGSTECVELLLKHGARINQPRSHSLYCEQLYYALGMIAYNTGSRRPANEPMLRLLLSRGASPNKLDGAETTMSIWEPPLFYALDDLPAGDKTTKRLIELLLKHGARVDQKDKKGRSVMTCAKHHGADVQNLLRQHGAV